MRWAFLLALACIGCSAPNSETWSGDERFTPAQRRSIESAAEWLTAQTGAPLARIEWRAGSSGRRIVLADLPDGVLGDSGRNDIRIDVAQCADRIGVVFAHELAHVHFGPCHHDEAGLMNARVPAALICTDADHQVTAACAPE